MKKVIVLLLIQVVFKSYTTAQELFPDRCLGEWQGMMYIYAKGSVRDSVPVKLTVVKTDKSDVWTWKTEYLSEKLPMVKDYTLKVKNLENKVYATDEGDGIELLDYQFGDKLYSTFETQDIFLTSEYELQGDKLIFEVTSGKKIDGAEGAEVINYSTINLQRAMFRKM